MFCFFFPPGVTEIGLCESEILQRSCSPLGEVPPWTIQLTFTDAWLFWESSQKSCRGAQHLVQIMLALSTPLHFGFQAFLFSHWNPAISGSPFQLIQHLETIPMYRSCFWSVICSWTINLFQSRVVRAGYLKCGWSFSCVFKTTIINLEFGKLILCNSRHLQCRWW